MSKISVFKFNISKNMDYNIINSIISDYLSENGFNYDYNEQCYIVGEASEKEANRIVANEVIRTTVNGLRGNIYRQQITTPLHPCFNYKIDENCLIIMAYTLIPFTGAKAYIHSKINTNAFGKEYYDNLKSDLFNELYQNNIELISVEKVKVKDKSTSKLLKKMIICVLPIIIIFGMIALFSYLSTH